MPTSLPSQTILAVQEGPGKVVKVSGADHSIQKMIKVGDKAHEIELTPDGKTAYVSNFGLLEASRKVGVPGTTISVLDVSRGVERTQFKLPGSLTAPHGLKLRPPKYRELFTNAEEGGEGMVVFDADSGRVLRTFPLPAGVHNFLFNADGSALFAFTLAGEVCRIDPETGNVGARLQTGSPRGLAWSAEGRFLIVSGKGEILFVDPIHMAVEKRIKDLGVGQVFYPSATSDGRLILAPAVLDGVVVVIDLATGAVIRRIETGSPLLLNVAPDGKKAWISNVLVPQGMLPAGAKPRNGGVMLLDLATFKTTAVAGLEDANGLAVIW